MNIVPFIIESSLLVFLLWPIRNKPRSNKACFVTAYLCLACLMLLYSYASRQILSSSTGFSGSIVRYIYRIACLFGYLYFRKEIKPSVALFDAAFAASILTSCSNIFVCPLLIDIQNQVMVFTGIHYIDVLICILIKELCYVVIFVAVRYSCPIARIDAVTTNRIIFSILVIMCNVFVRRTIVNISDTHTAVQNEISYYTILLQFFIIIFFIYHERFVQENLEKASIAQHELLTRLQLENLTIQEQATDNIRRIRHDMKNHLISINALAKNGENDRIVSYSESLLNDFGPSPVRIDTGSRILNAILSDKLRKADEQDIRTSVLLDFTDIDFISDTDLVPIFANAMDNAIEACMEIDRPENRFIDIRSGIAAGQLSVVISNSSNPRIRNSASLYETNKKNPLDHGFGLSNIERAVNKYGGIVRANYNDGTFTVIITIPMP